MFLIITYSNTKRFLKSTIQSFKSYFAGGYQRLPKTPPCNPFSCTHSRDDGAGIGMHTTTIRESNNMKVVKEPNLINNHHEVLDHIKKQEKNINGKVEKDESSSKCLVTRKLKELEMMDRNNVDLVLDIEEVLYYYSRLTCPVYRDIIEKFFVEMYSGTFVLSRVENSVSKKLLI